MTYGDEVMGSRITKRQTPVAIGDYHDHVRWGPILSGLVVALSTQLILSALGAAIGSTGIANSAAPRTNAGDVATGVGIWSIISLFISLFIGGWVTARACGPMNRNTAMLNGAILWATTLAISAWLVSSGVAGAFGVVASNAGAVINQAQQGTAQLPAQAPNVTAEQARAIADNIARVGWTFTIGSLLGLAAAIIGASIGTRRPRAVTTQTMAESRP
jgi:hypothetical protein